MVHASGMTKNGVCTLISLWKEVKSCLQQEEVSTHFFARCLWVAFFTFWSGPPFPKNVAVKVWKRRAYISFIFTASFVCFYWWREFRRSLDLSWINWQVLSRPPPPTFFFFIVSKEHEKSETNNETIVLKTLASGTRSFSRLLKLYFLTFRITQTKEAAAYLEASPQALILTVADQELISPAQTGVRCVLVIILPCKYYIHIDHDISLANEAATWRVWNLQFSTFPLLGSNHLL